MFRLALQLGYAHPDYLGQELSTEQLNEWYAYNIIDPIGKWRDELSIAQLCSLFVNTMMQVHRDPKKGQPKLTSPRDFMIDWDKEIAKKLDRSMAEEVEDKYQSPEEIKKTFLAHFPTIKDKRKKAIK